MKNIFTSLLFSIALLTVSANNLVVSNLTYLSGSNQIKFNVSWDNSWRNTNTTGSTQNYDGVWVFAKFRASCAKDSINPFDYHQVWLDTVNSNHSIPTGFTGTVGTTTVNGAPRGMGIFLYRNADGSGSVNLTNVTLHWDVASQGVIGTDWDIQLFAIEMVNIPQAPYYFGDGTMNYTMRTASTSSPFLMESETEVIPVATSSNPQDTMLQDNIFTSYYSSSFNIPASFPKAVNAFWVMKYELTQKQYCDFLNTLSRANQALCAPNCASSLTEGGATVAAVNRTAFAQHTFQYQYRNGIRILGPADSISAAVINPSRPATFVCDLNPLDTANSADDGQSVACNFLSATLLFRYLDWSGLRPMNEFEFEKICRGPVGVPIGYQYPQGNVGGGLGQNMQQSGNGLINAGTASEALTTVANGSGLVVAGIISSPYGPRRVGITQTAGSTRAQAGTSYYGVSDMAGNVGEICLRLGANSQTNPIPTYTRNDHGDGEMYTTFDVQKWPPYFNLSQAGVMERGGDWRITLPSNYVCVSYRPYLNVTNGIVDCSFGSACYFTDYGPNTVGLVPIASLGFELTELGGRGVRQAQ